MRIRSLRQEAGRSQEELASQVQRLWGLPWSRATVTAIEAGKRELSSKELVAVLDVFMVSAERLIAGEALSSQSELRSTYLKVSDTSSIALIVALRALDASVTGKADGRDTPWMRQAAEQITSIPEVRADLETAGVEATGEALSWVLAGERGETEKRAASALGVEPRRLAVAAVKLWGHSLTAERESRFGAKAGSASPSRSARTAKGHVTRQLLEELRSELEEG